MSEVKKCCTYRTARTALLKSAANMGFHGKSDFRASKIKPCAIREDLHRRKYRDHHSVIYGTVKHIHGIVVFRSVQSALPQTVKPIGCCYEQDYAERNLRGKRHLQNQHLSVTAVHRTENQYHEFMEEFLYEIQSEK